MPMRLQAGARASTDVSLRDLGLGQLFPLWLVSALIAWKALSPLTVDMLGIDTHAYWLTAHHNNLYGVGPGKLDAYLYSPAFATLIWPLAQLAYHPFLALWAALEVASFAWLLAPLGWRWAVPLLLLLAPVLTQGQIVGFLCIGAVVGMRHPAGWAFPLLTKITSGLGLVWFAVRMEWLSVAKVLGAAAMVSAISFALTPGDWLEWISFLATSGASSSSLFYVRIGLAVLITALGAWTDRPWLIAPAMWLASPVFVGIVGYSYLTAIPRLIQSRNLPSQHLAAHQAQPSAPATATAPEA
jgi:Glycosyltransferase family 87